MSTISTKQKGTKPSEIQENKNAQTENRQELQQLLILRTEQRVEERFSDKNLDRENEKIKLISGKEISISEIRAFISQSKQEYKTTFPKEFYREINRLNNWNKPDNELYLKPPIVGRYTNEIIYGRYPKEVLPTLQQINPYMYLGFRSAKHFQWLTESGKKQLEGFIEDAISVMKQSNDWYEFRVKYVKEFGIPFQLSLFRQ